MRLGHVRILVRLALAGLVLCAILPSVAWAQTFPISFQKLSDTDDSVDDFLSGPPPLRNCPGPCLTAHYVCRVLNCASADASGGCGTPNPLPVTGGIFTDTPPVATLPIDCARGVTVTGTGTWDPPVCDTAANRVTVRNISLPPGGSVIISFWSNVSCDNGILRNDALFDYAQNPTPGTPILARDPVTPAMPHGLVFVAGSPPLAQPAKDAPNLFIRMNRRYGEWGQVTPWTISASNTGCAAMDINAIWDVPDSDCFTVDCSTLRVFINGLPVATPPGTLCPDPARPAAFTLGPLTLQPGENLVIKFDAQFTSDTSIARCCNLGYFQIQGVDSVIYTQDPGLSTMLTPESTCATLNVASAPRVEAIKDAEDAAGNILTTITPGQDVVWHFKVINNGTPGVPFNLADDFPPAAVLDPASIIVPFPDGTCTITGQHLECSGVTAVALSTVEMKVRTAIDCSVIQGGDKICNEAIATIIGIGQSGPTRCTACPATQPANLSCVTLIAPEFAFSRKTVTDESGDGLLALGETATYRITALNTGTSVGTSVVVSDPIPPGTSFVSGSLRLDGAPLTEAVDGDAGEVSAGAVTVRVGVVPPVTAGVGVVTYDVRVDSYDGTQLCNVGARVDWAEAAACARDGVVMAPACMDYVPIIAPPELSVTKEVAPVGAVDPGANLSYTLRVCDGAAAGSATSVVLADVIPAQCTYVAESMALDGAPLTDAADADAGELVAAPAGLRVALGTLSAGQCHSLKFHVTVDTGAAGTVDNLAEVTADAVPTISSNTVTSPIRPPPVPPVLSLTKASQVAAPPATVGGTMIYTLHACNAPGVDAATNVVLSDDIPSDATSGCAADYAPESIQVGGVAQTDAADGDLATFVAAPAPGRVVVTLPTLAGGDCVDVTFGVTVGTGCDDRESLTNKATVVADGVAQVTSNAVTDVVTVDVTVPPNLMRKEGGPLVDRCPFPYNPCGCALGPRLDPVADDCLTLGTCTQGDASHWTIPGDLQRHVRLVYYELNGGGCMPLGDSTRLAVTKLPPDDIAVSLVP